MSIKTVAVIGLGLIGGSLAKAANAAGYHVVGDDIDPKTVQSALNDGAIKAQHEWCQGVDLYIIGLYVKDAIAFIKCNISAFKKGSIIIDVSGTKAEITGVLTDLCTQNGLRFVGTHPMQGKTLNGYSHSSEKLFTKASMIVTRLPQTDDKAADAVCDFAQSIGFAKRINCTPKHHDEMISYTSQLPHVLSSAYIQNKKSAHHIGFSAGSFADLSRVSELCPDMWCDLMSENSKELIADIETYELKLAEFKTALTKGDKEHLKTLLADGTAAKKHSKRPG